MKFKELIQQLKSLDGDLDIIVSSGLINGASEHQSSIDKERREVLITDLMDRI